MKCRLVFVLWLSIAGMVAVVAAGCARVPERIVPGPGEQLLKDVVVFESLETGETITGDVIYVTRESMEKTEEGRRQKKAIEQAMLESEM